MGVGDVGVLLVRALHLQQVDGLVLQRVRELVGDYEPLHERQPESLRQVDDRVEGPGARVVEGAGLLLQQVDEAGADVVVGGQQAEDGQAAPLALELAAGVLLLQKLDQVLPHLGARGYLDPHRAGAAHAGRLLHPRHQLLGQGLHPLPLRRQLLIGIFLDCGAENGQRRQRRRREQSLPSKHPLCSSRFQVPSV